MNLVSMLLFMMLLEKRGNIKETWAILNTVLGKQRKSVNYPTHLMQRDIAIYIFFFTLYCL